MDQQLSKAQLVELVQRIVNHEGTEEEVDGWVLTVERNVPAPGITDLIYHSREKLSPEEIVDRALAYKPIQL